MSSSVGGGTGAAADLATSGSLSEAARPCGAGLGAAGAGADAGAAATGAGGGVDGLGAGAAAGADDAGAGGTVDLGAVGADAGLDAAGAGAAGLAGAAPSLTYDSVRGEPNAEATALSTMAFTSARSSMRRVKELPPGRVTVSVEP